MKKFKINTESKTYKTIGRIKNIVFAVLLAVLVLILVFTTWARVSGKTPYFIGFAVYRISSGSMEPTLKTGEVILSQACDPMTLKAGDIITYEGKKGEFKGKTVTHRVEKPVYRDDGKLYLITKGDDNLSSDAPISPDQVLGKMIGKLDLITIFYNFFITPWGLIAIILLIILAFFNEIIVLAKAIIGFKSDDKDSLDRIIKRYQKELEEIEAQKESESKAETEQISPKPQRSIREPKTLNGRFTKRKKDIQNSNISQDKED